jgi:plasmid rolling circle replication initiator protein Rep
MGNQFNTLAQSGTAIFSDIDFELIVPGKGTLIKDNPALSQRAKRKTISQCMILSLIDSAKSKGEHERVKGYWNTFHCLQNVITANGKLYSTYCKNRFCTVCCAIRKAEIINKYLPILRDWEDAHFVTLTVKACKAKNLKKWIAGMFRAFALIYGRCKKRHQRGKGPKLIGIKSLECNFNPVSKTYNPHFHLIVPTEEIALLLKSEWLHQWKSKKQLFTYRNAQHIRKVNDIERDLVETIKYGSKIFTEPDVKRKGDKSIPRTLYASALDNILAAMKGKRIFERFGFNLPKLQKPESRLNLLTHYSRWSFLASQSDWVNLETGECLANYQMPNKLRFLLDNCIDNDLY